MLTTPLVHELDARKASTRGIAVSGLVALARLPRLADALASRDGDIAVHIAFSRDEEGRFIAQVACQGLLSVLCQRCLEPMVIALDSCSTLAVVASDEQAKHLPKSLEPWLVEDEHADLWAMVEDEIILALPFTAYHDETQCKVQLVNDEPPADDAPEAERDNPFNVLEQLKSSDRD
ncbi:MAG: nucleic acid-binding protein [Gammaproteobacteria bacterium]|nr:MAG: nucleic acid-binding protein [Gammaproteobacteria bacterium]